MKRRTTIARPTEGSPTVFLVLRRMRAPLIVLILIFAISVFGLTLIPGQDADGNPVRMGFFDAFYFMSYTATTIGYGEIPHPFTGAQRLWVTATIYLTVIGWAYAIGSLLATLRDRAFRDALALRRFTGTVKRLREPFLLVVGYGQTGQLLGHALDALGRRMVVVDSSPEHVDTLDIDPYHADIPGLVANAANPHHLGVAGLEHPCCEGVVALTDDDEVNLIVAMTAALIRPGLPVIARTVSPAIEHRMHAFGSPTVVNPFDRYGDHLRIALRAPSAYLLMSWLVRGEGAEMPAPGRPPATGRWVVCGFGRFGHKLVDDLRADGLEVTVIDLHPDEDPGLTVIEGDASEPSVLAAADLATAAGFVAGTDNDATNLSLVAAARKENNALFIGARQNRPQNAPLFAAMEIDWLLVPSEMAAREIYARLSTPLLWRFLQEMPALGEQWAADTLERMRAYCGMQLGPVWKVNLTDAEAPGLRPWLPSGVRLGDLLRSPGDRGQRLDAVPLMLLRGDETTLGPDDDTVLESGDQVLMAGRGRTPRALLDTMTNRVVAEYVLTGRHVPAGWVAQRVTGRIPASTESPVRSSDDPSNNRT
ncbi:potassium channel protein [Actinoplanes sp. LDG1-06]|uniref:Potassium channel protein n=1 Tax=Paractinoplanes ovalisporus TaxID=2810368 RepID=A0ABS2AEU4_9ACTN|nr:potassium channel protein [Actinoplanes ovalisporus]MBM2618355.1 potassium channel protein [Actinoplanes ovalisporus]